MKKLVSALVLFSFLCLCATAQELTAEQVVARHAEVTIRKGFLDTIRTYKMVAECVMSTGDSFKYTTVAIAGHAFYTHVASKGVTYVKIYNQGTAFSIQNGKKEFITEKSELDRLKLLTYMMPDAMYKQLGYRFTLEGESRQDGIEYYIVKLVSPNGHEQLNYYDKQSGLLTIIIDPVVGRTQLLRYEPFVGGFYMQKFVHHTKTGEAIESTISEFRPNVEIDPELLETFLK
ncbi:MAG TPA: hypothetical protein VFZ47_07710 [Chitinophagaceae bacterium]